MTESGHGRLGSKVDKIYHKKKSITTARIRVTTSSNALFFRNFIKNKHYENQIKH